MKKVLNYTKGYCIECQSTHDAKIYSVNNKVFFQLNCPKDTKTTQISNDLDIFLSIREKSVNHNYSPYYKGSLVFRYIDITNHCNFQCPICFADSSPNRNNFKKIEQIKMELDTIKSYEGTSVMFTGGEALLHPQIIEIVKEAKKRNLLIHILTNGYIINQNKKLILQLIKSGVWSFSLQFDTFNKKVHKILRNNTFIKEKINAIDFLYSHNIRFCFTSVISNLNINEINKLIKFASKYSPVLHSLNLVCLNPIKEVPNTNIQTIFREDIINKILNTNKLFSKNDFFPTPSLIPFRLNLHPDCSTLLYSLIIKGRTVKTENYIDLDFFYNKLKSIKTKNFYNKIKILLFLLQSLKKRKSIIVIQAMFNLFRGKGHTTLLPIMIGDFMSKYYLDVNRLQNCGACYSHNKSMIPACLFSYTFYKEENENFYLQNEKFIN